MPRVLRIIYVEVIVASFTLPVWNLDKHARLFNKLHLFKCSKVL